MMTFYRLTFCLLAAWISCCLAARAVPSNEQMGAILGYPASELVVEDITEQERNVWETPTASERRSGTSDSPPIQNLISAYKVTGKDPLTFFPLTICVARDGSFLTEEIRQKLEKFSKLPETSIAQGGRGPFGPIQFDGADAAGVYFGEIKTPSRIKEMRAPDKRSAMIGVFHLPQQSLEIRVALWAALDDGAKLTPVSGGESYYQSFGPDSHNSQKPPWDASEVFGGLAREAIDDPELASAPLPQRSSSSSTDASSRRDDITTTAQQEASTKSKFSVWIWVVGGVVLCFAAFPALKKRA